MGDLGLIPGLERSPGEGRGYPFQYSGLENSMDCIVHGIAKSWARLSDFHFNPVKEKLLPPFEDEEVEAQRTPCPRSQSQGDGWDSHPPALAFSSPFKTEAPSG